MDINSYIASGILESYVLGSTTPEEAVEVEQMSLKYPQLKAELRAIEDALESYAFDHAKHPPAHLKNQIWNVLVADTNNNEVAVKETKVVDFDSGEEIAPMVVKPSGFFSSYIRIAASLALLGSVLANIYVLTRWNESKESLTAAINENILLQKEVKNNDGMMKPSEVNLLMSPEVKTFKLMGQKVSPNSTVMLALDMKTNTVYLVRGNLPAPPAGMQYQLWAIVNDKPLDAGVFDIINNTQQLKKVPLPKAFAVTLEKKGGSATPTSDIFVLGI
ncbi:anti-sigma factor domain-containing protein [Emticicia sp. BO119]|uniref:anti-sigma factor n=1 Tax=Emticicia sp. BO119 TaxID=2757768 RepID=UPI0015F0F7AF|nr:anti-sigma factor [Emticicia sp. BO119]MBA4854080.1 anti-sigma factor [Emticicia sp. BO119]